MHKYNLDKVMSKRVAALTVAGVLVISGFGISKLVKRNDKSNPNSTNKSTTAVDINDNVLNKINSINELLTNDLKGKFDLNSDDKLSAVTLLNIDYIIKYGDEALKTLYPDGLNTKKELNDLESFLSKYREYTRDLKSVDGFINISDYALIKKDRIIIKELENMTKKVINSVNNNSNEDITSIYNKVYNFFVKGKSLNINGKNYYKKDLSNGYRFASENFASIINVLSRNRIKENTREKLDNELKTFDSVYQMQVLLEVFGNTKENVKDTLIDNNNSYVLDESDKEVIAEFKAKYDSVLKNTKNKFSVTLAEAKAITLIANIDYLASDNVSAGAMKTLLDKEIKTLYKDAWTFIKKAQNYNKNNAVKYNYTDLFVNDEENIVNAIAIKGAVQVVSNLDSQVGNNSNYNSIFNNSNFQFIKLYNQYSSKACLDANGTKITKNDTGYGTRFITNTIYNKSLNELPIKFKSIIELVNDDHDSLAVTPKINTMIQEKCSKYQRIKKR